MPVEAHLETCFALGQAMLEALERRDLEAYYRCLEERQEQLQALETSGQALPPAQARTWLERFRQQEEALNQALQAVTRDFSQALEETARYRKALQGYHTSPPPRRLLHPGLRG